MWVDIHSHILPKMDDGSKDLNMSLDMLRTLCCQDVDVVVATPHFYSYKETVDTFLERRADCFDSLKAEISGIGSKVLLGAEVRLELGVSDNDVKRLCIENTDLILLEFLNSNFEGWMIGEIENIIYSGSLTPVFAHVERYLDLFDGSAWNQIFSIPGAIAQFSVESLEFRRNKAFAYDLVKAGIPLILGSDTHNMVTRPPKFDVANRLLSKHGKYNQILQNVKLTQESLNLF